MAKQTVNIGASANDGTGDTIREAFNKVNDNFTEVYDNIDVANSVETDTSPALGGDLNVNGFSIVANTGTGVINIVPSTAGYLRLDGIKIDGTTITTHTNNTNITLDPHGTGRVLAEKIAFTGGTIDGVTIGATQPPTGTFDVLTVNTALQATGGSIDDIMIGSTTPSTGAFTSLEASEINADLINMAGHIIPTVDVSYDLGSPLLKWSELYVDVINGNSINLTGSVSGTFTGNLTGDVTGDLFGNADTATALQTAREINGVSFDGTADITVTADANTLSGTTLKSTVVNSSLTSVGTLTGLTIGASAAINAGNNVIANVADPLTNQDAANKLYVDTAITNLIDGAVPALDTLKEIADSLNNDTDIATTIVNGLAAKLDTAGGTMTGELYLNADPVSGTEAATKNYVDTQVSSAISAATTISSDDTSVVVTDDGVTDGKVEITVDGGLMVTVGPANISVESHRIVDVTDPSGPQDAATKKYVDDQIDGLATVASSGQYGDLTGTPTLALVATSGNYIDLNGLPDLVDFSADTIYATTQIHTAGAMLADNVSINNYVAIGDLDVGSLSRLDITDEEASGVTIQQVKNNLLDINSQGTLALSSTGDLTIQGLVYPSADGTAGDVVVTDGAGTLSFATPFSGAYGDLIDIIGSNGPQDIAIGTGAHDTFTTQLGFGTVAIGAYAGQTSQDALTVAIGSEAGKTLQSESAVAVGNQAGQANQSTKAVALGDRAGQNNQGEYSLAIGSSAGQGSQGDRAVAIGASAADSFQGAQAVAIGSEAGYTNQGANAIAVGFMAGNTAQAANTIILNATGIAVNGVSAQTDSFYVAPIRTDATPSNILYYNTTTKEVTYGSTLSYLPLTGGELTGKLLAAQGSGTTGGYSFGGTEGGADTGMFSNADGVLDFYADNNKIVTIDSAGATFNGRITLGGTVPAHSYGAAGDKAGMVVADATYVYYCTADYVNNTTDIWKRTAHGAGTW